MPLGFHCREGKELGLLLFFVSYFVAPLVAFWFASLLFVVAVFCSAVVNISQRLGAPPCISSCAEKNQRLTHVVKGLQRMNVDLAIYAQQLMVQVAQQTGNDMGASDPTSGLLLICAWFFLICRT